MKASNYRSALCPLSPQIPAVFIIQAIKASLELVGHAEGKGGKKSLYEVYHMDYMFSEVPHDLAL